MNNLLYYIIFIISVLFNKYYLNYIYTYLFLSIKRKKKKKYKY